MKNQKQKVDVFLQSKTFVLSDDTGMYGGAVSFRLIIVVFIVKAISQVFTATDGFLRKLFTFPDLTFIILYFD